MGLIRDIVRSRRGIEPPMGRPRMVPNIPEPISPLDPFERLPFDDPKNDFMSIQRVEDVGVPGITPIEPVMPPPIPLPIPPVPPPSIPAPTPLEKLPIQNLRKQQIFVPPRNIVDRNIPREILPTQPPVDMPIVEDDPIMKSLPVGDSVPFTPPVNKPVSQPAPTTPAAVADDVGAVPPTTIPPDTRGQIDPVLAQQDTSEVLSDPLLRALYFGTADQPGFINQLQQATQNVMGAELPSTQFDPSMTQQFFNPFEDRVVQQTIQDVMEAGEKRDIQQRARDIQTGGLSAFGSRARLTAADRQEALGRGLAEALGGIRLSGFSEAQRTALGQFGDQYARQMGQINRPIDLLTTVGRSLPGYGAQQTRIDSQYRLPVDPTAAGLGAAFNTYSALAPNTGAA